MPKKLCKWRESTISKFSQYFLCLLIVASLQSLYTFYVHNFVFQITASVWAGLSGRRWPGGPWLGARGAGFELL